MYFKYLYIYIYTGIFLDYIISTISRNSQTPEKKKHTDRENGSAFTKEVRS